MSNEFKTLNELLVKNFNYILKIEENVLKQKEETKKLSMTEIHTIEVIGESNRPIMSEVAEKLKITIGTLSIAINRLVKKGYIEKNTNKEDKRAFNLSLTGKGEKVFKVHAGFHKEMIDAVINDLTLEEFKVVINFLGRISSFFANKYNIGY